VSGIASVVSVAAAWTAFLRIELTNTNEVGLKKSKEKKLAVATHWN